MNPATDTIYVANALSDTVSVIDGGTNKVTANVKVAGQPSALDVDPGTNLIYAADIASGTVSVLSGESNSVTARVRVTS